MSKPKSLDNQLKEAKARLSEARAILLAQGFMGIQSARSDAGSYY